MSAKLIETNSLFAIEKNNNNARRTGFSSRTAGEILRVTSSVFIMFRSSPACTSRLR